MEGGKEKNEGEAEVNGGMEEVREGRKVDGGGGDVVIWEEVKRLRR